MKKILLSALLVAGALFTNQLNAQCTDLFFSEYIEGSSSNKAIEIYNPTNSKIGLDNYEVRLYSNGSSSAGTTLAFASTDSIGAYDVYVITNGSASLTGITSNSDVTSGVINYNGDDAIELYKISTTSSIDIIGVIGTDPGSSWSVTGTNSTSGSTKDNTIVRDPSIQQGQTNWAIGATEWMVFAQDMDDSLGTHIAACPVVVSPATSFSVTNTTCNAGADGAIDLTVTGGTAPYTYLWSNAATTEDLTGLAAATYTVTITDAASATKVDSAIVTEPAGMTINISVLNPVSCDGNNDGILKTNVSGGAGGYTYLWSNAITTSTNLNVGSGTYTVTVTDANSCTNTATYVLTAPAAIVITSAITNVSGNGLSDGSIDVSTTNGVSPLTYSWSNAATTEDISGLMAGTYSITVSDAWSCSSTQSFTITEPALFTTFVSTQANNACNGAAFGSLTVASSGGVSPYSYSWSNAAITATISNLTAGTYTVTATDANSITSTATATITEPTAITPSSSIINVTANGASNGAIDLTVSGGTTPYTYAWSNAATTEDITGLTAGTYVVTISDAFTCSATLSNVVTQPTSINLSSTKIDVLCNGASTGSIDLTVSGGTAPYTYAWSNAATTEDITVLTAGTYTVTVSDASSITATNSVVITEPTALVTSIAIDSTVSCNNLSNGGLTVSATGGTAPYTYSWSNAATTSAITGLSAGTYSTTVTDANGCTSIVNETVTEPTVLAASIVVDSNVTCNGLSNGGLMASATGGTAPYTYSWNNAATTAAITGLAAGTYSVTITDINNCTSISSATVIEPSVLVASVVVDTNVTCNGLSNGGLMASATGGTSPYTYVWSNAATTAAITGISAGTYSVTITDFNNCTATSSGAITEPSTLSLSNVATNVTTNGGADGAIDLTVSGGTNPYTFNWSNAATTEDITNLTAGTYSVTVTDINLCSATASVVITQPAGALANLIITEINYNGPEAGTDTSEFIEFVNAGTTAVDLTGYSFVEGVTFTFPSSSIAAGQYMVVAFDSSGFRNTFGFNADFVWSSGGLSNGGEDITIVDNFNRTVDSVDFDDAALWPAGFAAGQPDGGGASIVLCDSNSDNNIGSNWFAASSPVNGVIVNGLQVFANPGVGAPCVQPLVATITVDSNVTCNNGANGGLTVNVTSGSTPISYVWSNAAATASITGLVAGTYTVTITDGNSATLVDSAVITEPAPISFTTVIVDQTSLGNDGSIDLTVSGGTPGYTFLWSTADTTEDISGLNAGVYTVIITDTNNCVFTDSVTVGLSIGIQEATLQNNLLIYPNPSNGVFTIETIAQYDEIRILDITGKVVFMTEEYTLRNEIDLTSQQRGIYFISIQGESGRVVKKVIVN